MPSTRASVASLAALLALSGCVGGAGFLGLGHPTATVENDASGEYDVTVSVVHTETAWRDLPVELRYENGTVERTRIAPDWPEDSRPAYFVPENVTAFRVTGPPVDRWNVTLDPGASAMTNLTTWRPGDLVVVEWRRADGRVVRVKSISCRRGLQSFERFVGTLRGGGGGETSCTSLG